MGNYKASVIIPTKNAGKLFAEVLDAALRRESSCHPNS